MGKSYKKYVGNAKYLKKEDIPSPINTSILWTKEEEVTAPGKGTETRLVLYFDGLKKGLVLNTANAEALAEITGTDEYEQWSDVPIQLYVDRDVKYGGKKIGGIRIRKPTLVQVPVQEPEPVQTHSETETQAGTDIRYQSRSNPRIGTTAGTEN
jgi:hypothetical protein